MSRHKRCSQRPEIDLIKSSRFIKSVIAPTGRCIKIESCPLLRNLQKSPKYLTISSMLLLLLLALAGGPLRCHVISVRALAASRAQDITLDELEASGIGGGGQADENIDEDAEAEDKMKNLDALLETLPVLSVGQKHVARFECELNKDTADGGGAPVKLVWIKLIRGQELAGGSKHNKPTRLARDDTKLISLDQKLITPDKRFKVHRQAAYKWALSLDNVQPEDGNAYYLCQASAAEPSAAPARPPSSCIRRPGSASSGAGNSSSLCEPAQQRAKPEAGRLGGSGSGSSFKGGARLNVLAPPRIVEQDTSASLVMADEHEPLTIRCKVWGEPQSQLMWKREDQRSLDGAEQRFRHESQRKPNHQILSIDSSELVFEPFLRSHSGAYLCIASNGIQPGVSQRINVMAANCRSPGNQSSGASEPCDQPPSSSSSSETTTSGEQPAGAGRKLWRTPGRQLEPGSTSSQQIVVGGGGSKSAKHLRLQAADKRRSSASNRNGPGSEQQTNGFQGVSIKQSSPTSSGSSLTPTSLISWPLCSAAASSLPLLLLLLLQ